MLNSKTLPKCEIIYELGVGTESHRIPELLYHRNVSWLGHCKFRKGKLSI